MKINFTPRFKSIFCFIVIGIFFIPNYLFARTQITANGKNPNIENSIVIEDWKVLVETSDISIYYQEILNNPCMSYKLKIVNHTNQKQTISFGIASKLADDCKGLYKNFSEFQYRKIEVDANSTLIGDENTKSLLIPFTTKSLKETLQNLISL